MKIALISSGYLPVTDGVTVLLKNRLRWLSRHGHTVKLFCPDYKPIAAMFPDWADHVGEILPGVEVLPLPSCPFFGLDFERNIVRSAHGLLNKHLARFEPDVVHVDEPERIAMTTYRRFGLAFARRHHIPCLASYHTNWVEYTEDMPGGMPKPLVKPVEFFGKMFIRWSYQSYDATFVSGPTTNEKLVSYGLRNTRCAQLNGFDRERFSPNLRKPGFFGSRYDLAAFDNKVKIVILGRLTSDKGWGFFLEALPKAAAETRIEDLAFAIVGGGDMAEELAEKLKWVPNLHFFGRLPNDKVPALLANCDFLLSCSEKEHFSLAVNEAMGSGLPIFAPRAGGMIDQVEEGKSGFLFTPKDKDDFTGKLKTLVEDPALRQQMGARSMELAASFAWDKTFQNWMTLVEEYVAARPASRIIQEIS